MAVKSLLKQVIIRVDFTPISEFSKFISTLKMNPEMKLYYDRCREIKTNNINIVLNQNRDELRTAKLNVNETTSVFRFMGNSQMFNQRSTFDVGNEFMCLTIECDDNYTSCEMYRKFVAEKVALVKSIDPYILITRIGIRKIDVADFNDVVQGNNAFNTMKARITEYKEDEDKKRYVLKQSYSEHFHYEKENAEMVSTRSFRGVPEKKQYIYRYVLDTDAFYHDSLIDNREEDVHSYMNNSFDLLNAMLYDNYIQNIDAENLDNYDYE